MTTNKKDSLFSEEESAVLAEMAQDRKSASKGKSSEQMVLEKISHMAEPDRSIAQKIHEIVTKNAPELTPKTWYGMPAYANKEGKVICFFQDAAKFKSRYATFGFNDPANLDAGSMWPTSFALTKLTPDNEAMISKLLKKAVG